MGAMYQAGDQLGPYELVMFLGQGGSGEAWLANWRTHITTSVVLKVGVDAALKEEASVWATITGHPNIVSILCLEEHDGHLVLVSEYAEGGMLREHLTGPLPVPKSVEIIEGVLKGLMHLHSHGIIHRDVKPENVVFKHGTPKILDFDISRVTKGPPKKLDTNAGTGCYMAPEALQHGARSPKTDLWSVGVMFFEMVSGYRPFPDDNYLLMITAICGADPAPFLDSVPAKIRRIILRCLEKSEDARYTNAEDMLDELKSWEDSP
jgi:serine/threonine protein kinase